MSSHYLTQQDKKLRLRQKAGWGRKIQTIIQRPYTFNLHVYSESSKPIMTKVQVLATTVYLLIATLVRGAVLRLSRWALVTR
jgi:hypothetical protein